MDWEITATQNDEANTYSCHQCGNGFRSTHWRKYCEPCVTHECVQCGHTFRRTPSKCLDTRGRFCSRSCSSRWTAIHVTANSFAAARAASVEQRAQHLSQSMMGKPNLALRGRRRSDGPSPNDIRKYERHRTEYRQWRTAVFDRDDYRCQMPGCDKRGGELRAHHIRPWAQFPEHRYDVTNGLTLCDDCHRAVHRGHGPEEFLCQTG